MKEEKKILTTRFLVRAGIFSALAILLYLLVKIPVPFFPPFLKFHFDEVPVFIASFAYGPLMGLTVLVIKTLLSLPFTFAESFGVGELADLVYSICFIIPASIIYQKRRKFSSVIIGLAIGFVSELIVSSLFNIYVIIPFYNGMLGFSEDQILTLCQAANADIVDLKWSFVLFAALPFNAIKNILVIALTLPTYKVLHKLIDKIQIK